MNNLPLKTANTLLTNFFDSAGFRLERVYTSDRSDIVFADMYRHHLMILYRVLIMAEVSSYNAQDCRDMWTAVL